jgi:hypothetical protein
VENWTIRLTTLGLVFLLAACTGPARPGASQSRPSASPAVAASPGSIDAFVPVAAAFVESHRGLRFKQTVKVEHLSDAEFSQRIVSLQRRDRADTDRQAKLFQALGLIDKGVDVEKAEEELLSAGVVGYYDPKTKDLVVRGDTATVSVKHVVVHELTHALQDQWFGLDVNQGDQTDDQALAYVALVEGDAVRIEREYVTSLSSSERDQLSREGAGGGGPSSAVPRVLVQLLTFPYVAGPPFTSAVLQARGQPGLDKAFKDRPAATSQVVQADRFLNGDQPQPVAEPPADGAVFDRGVLGEVELGVLLGERAPSALTREQEQDAAQAWAGDRYVAWTSGDSYCLRVRFAARNPAGATAIGSALEKVASSGSGAQVEKGPQPVLTSCG